MTEPAKKTPARTARQMAASAKPSPGGARATATKAKKQEPEEKSARPEPTQEELEAMLTKGAPGPAKDISEAEDVNNTTVTGAPDTGQRWPVGYVGPGMIAPYESPVVTFPSVHESWSRVMDSVKSVEKGDYNKDQHFRFRGIDAVMEAVGPALRQNHVHVRPRRILEHSVTEYTSKNGARMVNRLVRIEWEVTGPGGDSFTGESMGEAADSSDKSMTKAQSVAYRVFLLNALTVPTGDPDPDAETPERAGPSERQQAVAQASEKTYASREEFERERQRQAQETARQDQAGEDNQAAQVDNAEARKELWTTAKGLGWEWKALAARFKSDYGMETKEADAATIESFMGIIISEAQAEEDRARQVVQEQLGGTEIQPDEAQSGGLL